MEEEKTRPVFCCVNAEEKVLTFREQPGWEKKEFDTRQNMMDFCFMLLSTGYKVM